MEDACRAPDELCGFCTGHEIAAIGLDAPGVVILRIVTNIPGWEGLIERMHWRGTCFGEGFSYIGIYGYQAVCYNEYNWACDFLHYPGLREGTTYST